ncbi:MAG: hypothetical protein J7452_06955 [Thermoflexus sp.]|nr:hypothetical protein [Thermoflexus sp.]
MTSRRAVLLIGLLGIGIGLGAGFLLGRHVWPVRYVDVAPADLRPEWQAEYVRMVALAYIRERDPALARARLALLGDPVAVLRGQRASGAPPLSPAARAAMEELLRALEGAGLQAPTGGPP